MVDSSPARGGAEQLLADLRSSSWRAVQCKKIQSRMMARVARRDCGSGDAWPNMVRIGGNAVPFGKVSLPMYNLPEMQSDNRAFWGAMRVELSRLGLDDLPDDLDFTRRPVPAEIETDTLFTQVCGYPLQTIYRRQAALLGRARLCGPLLQGRDPLRRLHRGCQLEVQAAGGSSRLPLCLQQSPFQFGHEPAAPRDRGYRRRQAVFRVDSGDA